MVAKTCKNPYPARIFARYKSIKKRAEAQGEKPFVFARKNKPKNSIIYNAFFRCKIRAKKPCFFTSKKHRKNAQKKSAFLRNKTVRDRTLFFVQKSVQKNVQKSRAKKTQKIKQKSRIVFRKNMLQKSPHFYLGKTYDFFDFTAMFLPLVFTALST
jgi:hypothetical protein